MVHKMKTFSYNNHNDTWLCNDISVIILNYLCNVMMFSIWWNISNVVFLSFQCSYHDLQGRKNVLHCDNWSWERQEIYNEIRNILTIVRNSNAIQMFTSQCGFTFILEHIFTLLHLHLITMKQEMFTIQKYTMTFHRRL